MERPDIEGVIYKHALAEMSFAEWGAKAQLEWKALPPHVKLWRRTRGLYFDILERLGWLR